MIRPSAVSPGLAGLFCRRVLIVSIGALEKGPTAPDIKPMREVWYAGTSPELWYFVSWVRR